MLTNHLLTPMLYSSGEIGAFRTHIVDHVTGRSILSVCIYFYSRNSCHGDCERDQAVSSVRLRWSEDCQKCNINAECYFDSSGSKAKCCQSILLPSVDSQSSFHWVAEDGKLASSTLLHKVLASI